MLYKLSVMYEIFFRQVLQAQNTPSHAAKLTKTSDEQESNCRVHFIEVQRAGPRCRTQASSRHVSDAVEFQTQSQGSLVQVGQRCPGSRKDTQSPICVKSPGRGEEPGT